MTISFSIGWVALYRAAKDGPREPLGPAKNRAQLLQPGSLALASGLETFMNSSRDSVRGGGVGSGSRQDSGALRVNDEFF